MLIGPAPYSATLSCAKGFPVVTGVAVNGLRENCS